MLNEFSSNITIFALVLMVLVLIGATVEGVRPAFTLLVAAARAAGAVLVRCARRRPVAVSPHSRGGPVSPDRSRLLARSIGRAAIGLSSRRSARRVRRFLGRPA